MGGGALDTPTWGRWQAWEPEPPGNRGRDSAPGEPTHRGELAHTGRRPEVRLGSPSSPHGNAALSCFLLAKTREVGGATDPGFRLAAHWLIVG